MDHGRCDIAAVGTNLFDMTHTLRNLGELIAYLPYELGFVATDSLVAVGLSHDRVTVVARMDLGDDFAFADCADTTADAFGRAGIDEAICCVLLDPGMPARPATARADHVRRRFARRGVRVRHVLMSTEGTWWAQLCSCGACPTRPTRVPGPERVDAVLASVVEGMAPCASRADLARSLRRTRADLARRVAAHVPAARALPAQELVAVLWQIMHGSQEIAQIPAVVLASVSVSLRNGGTRDEVFSWVTPAMPMLSSTAHPVHRARQLRLVDAAARGAPQLSTTQTRGRMIEWLQCLPDPLRPPVLTLIAGSAWSAGSGALASIAVEQALQIDPGYRLALLLGRACGSGLRPHLLAESR